MTLKLKELGGSCATLGELYGTELDLLLSFVIELAKVLEKGCADEGPKKFIV